MLTGAPIVAVSTKMYFSHARGTRWLTEVAERARRHTGIMAGAVQLIVVPGYLQILPALDSFAATPVMVGAQDAATTADGAFTGEVSPAELAELGVQVVELGHAERRLLYHEDDQLVAAKAAAAIRSGLTPLLCVGENIRMETEAAARTTVGQLDAALSAAPGGAVIVAYEPRWAIGTREPASLAHIAGVTRSIREVLVDRPDRVGSGVIYGGSAGPGLLAAAGQTIDGLFLGRFAHDVDALFAVVDEACARDSGGIREVPT
jgi:triosephosphate isomerase (TIM)